MHPTSDWLAPHSRLRPSTTISTLRGSAGVAVLDPNGSPRRGGRGAAAQAVHPRGRRLWHPDPRRDRPGTANRDRTSELTPPCPARAVAPPKAEGRSRRSAPPRGAYGLPLEEDSQAAEHLMRRVLGINGTPSKTGGPCVKSRVFRLDVPVAGEQF